MSVGPVWEIIDSLKLVDYLHVQSDNHGKLKYPAKCLHFFLMLHL